jgi:hypothetical protein
VSLAIASATIVTVPGTGALQLLTARQERVYFVVAWQGGGNPVFLGIFDDGSEDSSFWIVSDNSSVTFLRKDLGALVQGDIYASNTLGDVPAGTITITEAWLTN